MKKILNIMIGLPRSGKSIYCKSKGAPIVSPDAIRRALHGETFRTPAEPMVWAIAKYMVTALFEAGHDEVSLDATNITVKCREDWVDERWCRRFVEINTPGYICIQRAEKAMRWDLIPIIQRMEKSYEIPHYSEYREWEK